MISKTVVVLVFTALCYLVSGTTNVAFDPRLLLQVQSEDAMSRVLVDFSMKLRNSMQQMQAANLYQQVLSLEFQERHSSRSSLEEEGSDAENDFSLENDSFLEVERSLEEIKAKTHYTLFGEGEESDKKQSKLLTYAAHEMFIATKLKYYQTVLKSRDIQANFWMDRYVQLQVLSAGAATNPQMLQFLYIKMYRTNLETMKLALTFQYLSHFVTWVEDELDVQSVLGSDSTSLTSKRVIAKDQGDDLIRDKLWAFSTYHSAASIELQAYYIDLYLTYAFNAVQPSLFQAPTAAAANNAAASSSFIEEEMTEQSTPTTTENQFFPFMGAQQQNPMMYMTYLKLYYLMIQYSGARAALTSAFAEKLAFEKKANAVNYRKFAQNMFGGEFARNFAMGANIKYMTTIWEWYMIIFAQQQQPVTPAPATTTATGTTGSQ